MSCCFAAVYREKIPLVNFSAEPGNWDKLYANMVQHSQIHEGFQVNKADGFSWAIHLGDGGLTFVIVARGADTYFLERCIDTLKSSFLVSNPTGWRTCDAFGLQNVYEGSLRSSLAQFSQALRSQTKAAPIMDLTHAVNVPLERDLRSFDESFVPGGSIMRHKKKKCMWYVVIVLLAVVILYLIIALSCGGFDFRPRCLKRV